MLFFAYFESKCVNAKNIIYSCVILQKITKIMKKQLFRLLSLVLIVFACTACPYQSEVPVGEAISLDPAVVGKWKTPLGKKEDYMEVRQTDDKYYLIVEYSYNQTQKQYATKEYTAHLSELNGTKYLNVKVKKVDEKNSTPPSGLFLHKIDIKGNEIVLSPLSEFIREKFSTSADLQNFIQKHSNLSFFFGEDQVFTKIN